MRKTDEIAKSKFNGNIKETIEFILENYKDKELDTFVFEWNTQEAQIAMDFINKKIKENIPKDEMNKIINEESTLDRLKLTKEDVINAEKNPYRATLGRKFLKLLIVNGGLIALAAILQNLNVGISENIIEAVALGATSMFTTYVASDIGLNLTNYFKFKKLKNQYNKEEETNELNKTGGIRL